MLPSDFWEHTPADVADYIEAREERSNREMYYSSVLQARFTAILISNLFSKMRHDIPQYDEIFGQPKTWQQNLDNRIEEIKLKFGGYRNGR